MTPLKQLLFRLNNRGHDDWAYPNRARQGDRDLARDIMVLLERDDPAIEDIITSALARHRSPLKAAGGEW